MFKIKMLLLSAVTGILCGSAVFAAEPSVKPFAELDFYAGYDHSKTAEAAHNAFAYGIISSTALGADVEYDKLTGKFAAGFADVSGDLAVSAREAYLNFDNGLYSVMIGQNTAPSVVWSSEAAFANNSTGFGALDMDYALQTKITFFGAYVDIIKSVYTPYVKEYDTATGDVKGTARTDLPIGAAGYDYKSETVSFGFGGLGTFYNRNSEANNKRTYAWLAYAHTNLVFGDFSILGSVGYGQNTGNMNFGEAGGISDNQATISQAYAYYNSSEDKVYNPTHLEGFLEFGYASSKTLTLHLGGGYAQTDFDQSGVKNDVAYEGYFNGYYTVNDHLTLAPEVAVYKFEKGTTNAKDCYSVFAGVLATVGI